MKDMIKAYAESGEWFGRFEELVENIEEKGYEVIESNREYISFIDPEDDEDTEYVAYIGGTERTFYIDRVQEV